MATQYVCFHNKYGYCKYGEECRKRHVNTICEESSCDIRNVCQDIPKFASTTITIEGVNLTPVLSYMLTKMSLLRRWKKKM